MHPTNVFKLYLDIYFNAVEGLSLIYKLIQFLIK